MSKTLALKFGVFDHMDWADVDLSRQYEDRLHLAEAYDRAGFHAYHVAEHHGTPLGLASSPNLFLSAVAQRTYRLRLGPLVMALSLYHPLRAFEEICMLDQMSRGRLELGIGRGISPIELGYFGVGAQEAQERYLEVSAIILAAMKGGPVTFEGRYFDINNVPTVLKPLQRPHPPLWYGAARPETAAWGAENNINVVASGSVTSVRAITDAYRARWAALAHDGSTMPLLGMSRHIVIAATDAEAHALAAPAYERWFASLTHLWRQHGLEIPLGFPSSFADAVYMGYCIAGSAATVRNTMLAQARDAGISYLLCRVAFGTLPFEASLATVAAMEREILPAFEAGELPA